MPDAMRPSMSSWMVMWCLPRGSLTRELGGVRGSANGLQFDHFFSLLPSTDAFFEGTGGGGGDGFSDSGKSRKKFG